MSEERLKFPNPDRLPQASSAYLSQYRGGGSFGNSPIAPKDIFIFMQIPPDGGYSWVILFISFTVSAVVDGMALNAGSILDAISEDLNFSTSEATSLSSVQNAVYLFSGPAVCAVANSYGFRIPAMIGGTMAALGFLTASFCQSWLGLVFTYGLMVGVGFGFVSSPNALIVGYYFEKYRAIASGISSSGVGAGTIIFSRLNIILLESLLWRSTLKVYFGICATLILVSLFYRPIKPINVTLPGHHLESSDSFESEPSESVLFTSKFIRYDDTPKVTIESRHSIHKVESANRIVKFFNFTKTKCANCCKCFKSETKTEEKGIIGARPLFRQDIFYERSRQTPQSDGTSVGPDVKQQQQQQQQFPVRSTMQSGQTTIRSVKLSPKAEKHTFSFRKLFRVSTIKGGFQVLFDFSVLEIKSIRPYLASAFFLMLANITPFLFVQKYGLSNGIPEKFTHWYMPTLGIANIVFRILGGLIITFKSDMNPLYIPAVCLLFSGVFTFLAGLVGQKSVAFQFFWLIMFGLGTAVFISLRAPIIVYCAGIDKLTNCYGIIMLVLGLGTFLGTTFAGILVSLTNAYEPAFLFAGCGIFVSSMLLFATAMVANAEKKLSKK